MFKNAKQLATFTAYKGQLAKTLKRLKRMQVGTRRRSSCSIKILNVSELVSVDLVSGLGFDESHHELIARQALSNAFLEELPL